MPCPCQAILAPAPHDIRLIQQSRRQTLTDKRSKQVVNSTCRHNMLAYNSSAPPGNTSIYFLSAEEPGPTNRQGLVQLLDEDTLFEHEIEV